MAIENGIAQDGTGSGGGGSPIEANEQTDLFVGDGNTLTFTLSQIFIPGSVKAFLDGQKYPDNQVIENPGLNQVTIPTSGGSAPSAQSNIEFVYLYETP